MLEPYFLEKFFSDDDDLEYYIHLDDDAPSISYSDAMCLELNRQLQDDDECIDSPTVTVFSDTIYEKTDEESYTAKGAEKYYNMGLKVCDYYQCEMAQEEILFYNAQYGYFERPSLKRKKQLILRTLSQRELKKLPVKDGIKNIMVKMEEILLAAGNYNVEDVVEFNCVENYVNVLNCIVECKSRDDIAIHEHSVDIARESMFDYCVNFNYIMEKRLRNTKAFDRYCLTTFKDEAESARKVILQYIGYLLGDSMKGKCMLVMVGKSNAGKTVLMNLIEAMIPKTHRSYVELCDFSNPIKRGRLRGKKVNLQSELPSDKIGSIDTIKAATSGDMLSGEAKYQDPYDFINNAKIMWFTNVLPKLRDIDPTDGFFSRLRVLYFPYSIPKEEQNPYLLDELMKEKDSIGSEAIDAYAELLENNFVFEETASSRAYMEKYFSTADPIRTFVQEEMVVHPDAMVHRKALKDYFAIYCIDNGIDDRKFLTAKLVERLEYMPGVSESKFRFHDKHTQGYKGIGLRCDFPMLKEGGEKDA